MKEMHAEVEFKLRIANNKLPGSSEPAARDQSLFRKNNTAPRLSDKVSLSLWRLDPAALCAEARRHTGLHDFGEPPLEPGLSILVESLERQADLKPFGRFLIRTHLLDLLQGRLRLTQAWKGKKDQLQAEPIRKPIFIVGMPRSGSTFLHELLAEDPRHRAPRAWEVMFPLRSRPDAQKDTARR